MAEPSVGPSVRGARRRAGVSLRELARRIEVSAGTLSAIENGKTAVTVDRLGAIAAALGCSTVDLLQPAPPPVAEPTPRENPGTDWRRFDPLPHNGVLDAAIATFVATGYHGATIREVAANAGMSVPGVYHHYPSKQHLLVAILDIAMEDLHWRVPAARDSAERPVDRVWCMVEALALFHTHRAGIGFIGASEMRSIAEPDRARITLRRDAIQYMLDAEIDAGIRTGDFTTAHPRDAARAITTMCTSLPQWFHADGPISPEQIATEYARFALDMLRG